MGMFTYLWSFASLYLFMNVSLPASHSTCYHLRCDCVSDKMAGNYVQQLFELEQGKNMFYGPVTRRLLCRRRCKPCFEFMCCRRGSPKGTILYYRRAAEGGEAEKTATDAASQGCGGWRPGGSWRMSALPIAVRAGGGAESTSCGSPATSRSGSATVEGTSSSTPRSQR